MEGWEEIETFAYERKAWLKTFIDLKNGVPPHDTFRRVFEKLEPKLFQTDFIHLDLSLKLPPLGGQIYL